MTLNNLHWDLEKLMKEITSVFWVDLEYILRSWDTVPLQGSGGWLASYIVHIIIVIDYLAVGTDSAPGDWAVVSGMYGTHLKHG